MSESGLGVALRALRDRRMLSTRELGKLADVDHAYIYRLETGEKSSPSDDLVRKLLSVLKADERESEIIRWLVDHQDADPDLVKYVVDNPAVEFEVFAIAAGVRHRGTGRPDPATLVQRIRAAIKAVRDN